MENELLEFVIGKLTTELSLEELKKGYDFYGKDLCQQTEEDFRIYMFMFFLGKKLNVLAQALADKSRDYVLFSLLKDMKVGIEPSLYHELISGAIPYGAFAAPYLLLYEYISQLKGKRFLLLTVKEWQSHKTREAFLKFLSENYPDENAHKLSSLIDERIAKLREQQ